MLMLKTLASLPRSVWLIGLISLVNDSASEMLYPTVLGLSIDGGAKGNWLN